MRGIRIIFLLQIGLLFCLTFSAPAYAVIGGLNDNINGCSTYARWMVTSRMVDCITKALGGQVNAMLEVLIPAIKPFAIAFYTFVIMMIGAKILMGMDDFRKESMAFLVRMTVAFFVFYNFSPTSIDANSFELGLVPFAIVKSGSQMVSTAISPGNNPGWTPWESLDIAMGSILGYGPNTSLFNNPTGHTPFRGLLGLIGMSVTSSLLGILNFLFGFIGVLAIIYFGLRAVFSYLAALVMIAFIVVIAPLLMPFVILRYTTERFVKKWLDLLIACMLNPVMIFAFLAAFTPIIQNLINAFYAFTFYIVTGDANALPGSLNVGAIFGRTGGNFTSWQVPSDPALLEAFDQQLTGAGGGATSPSMQNFMNPNLSSTMDVGSLDFSYIDFGPQGVQIMQNMILSSLGFFIVAYLMLMLLDGIPQISDSIARVITGLAFEEMPFAKELRAAVSRLRGAMAGTS